MSDLAVAAAAAGSPQAAVAAAAAAAQAGNAVQGYNNQNGGAPVGAASHGHHAAVRDNPHELPSVDDLEVAALAAASALKAIQELQQLSSEEEDEDDSSSDDDDSSDDSDDSSSSEADEDDGSEGQRQQQQQVAVQLVPSSEGHLSVVLQLHEAAGKPRRGFTSDDDMADSSSSSSSSEEEEEDEAATGSDVEIMDYNEMREMIDRAYRVVDAEGDDASAAGGVASLQADLGWEAVAPPVTGLQVPEGATLSQAGSISSLLEDMVVVQGLENSRALDAGSVLLLSDRTPIGRVEEVFGRVSTPLYALRYSGPQPPPPELAVNARVFFTDALAHLVDDEVYVSGKARGGRGAVAADPTDADGDDEEPYFSDDEAEAEWRRSQGLTKRKHSSSGGGAGSEMGDGAAGERGAAAGQQGGRGRGSGRGRGRGRGRFSGPDAPQAAVNGGGGGRGREGTGAPGFRGGPPSAGFRAHATAGQLQRMGLQQQPQQPPPPRPPMHPQQQQQYHHYQQQQQQQMHHQQPPYGQVAQQHWPPRQQQQQQQQQQMGAWVPGTGGYAPVPLSGPHTAAHYMHNSQQQQQPAAAGTWMQQHPQQQHPGAYGASMGMQGPRSAAGVVYGSHPGGAQPPANPYGQAPHHPPQQWTGYGAPPS